MSATPIPAEISAVTPVPKLEKDFYDWYQRHDSKMQLAAERNHDLLFIGDSITHLFEGDTTLPGRGESVWAKHFAPRNALNLGFGWDRTQNVLWRLTHGEIKNQTPKLAVILIGTNNLTGTANAATNTPAQIVDGIAAIARVLRDAAPRARLLILGLLPRSTPTDPLRQRILETNALLQPRAVQLQADYLDLGRHFLDAQNQIPRALMGDTVHPTTAGYQIWAEQILPIVDRALG